MRIQKAVFLVGIFLLTGFFIAGVANAAPDMNQWAGRWFSFQMTKKGIIFDGSTFIKDSEKNSGYFEIESWNQTEERFEITVYAQNNGGWNIMTQYINYFAGDNLSFLFWYHDEDMQFVGQLVGKGKGQIISSATITTYGGIVLAAADGQPAIGNVVFKAKMIDESKVKAPH